MSGFNYIAARGSVIEAFHLSPARVRGLMGPIGSGKSTACVAEILRRAQGQAPGPDGVRRTRFAAIRNTYPELRSTTIKTWHEWVPAAVGGMVWQAPPTHRVRGGDVDLEMIFLALDRAEDVGKLLSLELTGAWVNEAREVPKAVVDALTGRIGRYPSMRRGGPTWHGIVMDTNAPDTGHWWFKLAEEGTPDGWQFFRQPGAVTGTAGPDGALWRANPKAENLSRLPPGYYAGALAGKAADWVNCYLAADYGWVKEGKPVIPEYDDRAMTREYIAADALLPVQIGVDFGLTPAAVIGQCTRRGGWAILAELVADDMGLNRFVPVLKQEIARRCPAAREILVWGDPAGHTRDQVFESTAFEHLRRSGLTARAAPTNDPDLRIEAIRAPMTRLVDGKPGIAIDRQCAVLRKALGGGWRYKQLALSGEARFAERPHKNEFSHVADALGYLLLGGGEHRPARMPSAASSPAFARTDWDPR